MCARTHRVHKLSQFEIATWENNIAHGFSKQTNKQIGDRCRNYWVLKAKHSENHFDDVSEKNIFLFFFYARTRNEIDDGIEISSRQWIRHIFYGL